MSSTITFSGTYTVSQGSTRNVGTISDSITCTGSNFVDLTQNIPTSSYAPLITSSLSDTRYMYFNNQDATASIIISSGSAGEGRICVLYPSDTAVIPWSGSLLPLYARASSNSGTTAELQYKLSEV